MKSSWKDLKTWQKIALIFLVLIILSVSIGDRSPQVKKSTTKTEENIGKKDGSIAVVCAQTEVEKKLKSPSSSKFPMGIGMSFNPLGENKYTVKSYVDAQNAFGADIRSNFLCVVEVLNPKDFECSTECVFE